MKTKLLSLSLLAVALVGPSTLLAAAESAPVTVRAASLNAPDPAMEIKHLAELFRAGDLAGLAQGLTPRRQWDQARAAYELQRNKPTSDAERARFAEKMQQFTAPDAVDQLMAKLEPELAKARPQAAGMLLMGMGALSVAVNSSETKLTDAQREALRGALPGIQRWVNTTDFFSVASLRRSLTVLTDAARRTGITDVDQLKALPLEGVLERAGPMLTAAKEAVRTYGIDLDAVADSLRVDVLERGQDTARVRTTITVFGAPVWAEHDLVLIDGHWYGKHVQVDLDDVTDLQG
ncbi:hypothetical protein [Tahibacter caeni]|uniref:hypothetical protein n=1 Tax=Tahibacter caeni TaxID=1453545 RepID=UPI0021477A7B|nr:hypothetical protein [Tahibacter caeni]